MSTPDEKTLKPWRLKLALRLLGITDRAAMHRAEISRNVVTVWDRPNPYDAGCFITFTYGKDVKL